MQTENKFEVTNIQFFKYESPRQINEEGDFETDVSYSANVVINNNFVIQCAGDLDSCNYSMPSSSECYWKNEEAQDFALENYLKSEIVDAIEADGFENNIGYLEDHGEKM